MAAERAQGSVLGNLGELSPAYRLMIGLVGRSRDTHGDVEVDLVEGGFVQAGRDGSLHHDVLETFTAGESRLANIFDRGREREAGDTVAAGKGVVTYGGDSVDGGVVIFGVGVAAAGAVGRDGFGNGELSGRLAVAFPGLVLVVGGIGHLHSGTVLASSAGNIEIKRIAVNLLGKIELLGTEAQRQQEQ